MHGVGVPWPGLTKFALWVNACVPSPCLLHCRHWDTSAVGVQSIVFARSQGSRLQPSKGKRGHFSLQHTPGAAGNRQRQQSTESKVFCKQKGAGGFLIWHRGGGAAHLAGAHLAGAHLAAGTAWQRPRGRRR